MIIAEYLDLAAALENAGEDAWNAPSLCAGWRTREVVAHLTMPLRYGPETFLEELSKADGDFNHLADVIAKRDAAELCPEELLASLRDPRLHDWQPPGGGQRGALTHVVIHGLDVTVPLGIGRRVPEERLRVALEVGRSLAQDEPAATDEQELALLLFGRRLPKA